MKLNEDLRKRLVAHIENPRCEPAGVLGAAIKALKESTDVRDRMTGEAVDLFLTEWFQKGLPATMGAKQLLRPQ